MLVSDYLPLAPGLGDALAAGAGLTNVRFEVADVASSRDRPALT